MAADLDLIDEVLTNNGFEVLPRPLIVGGASFDFDTAARGTGVSHDLVIISRGSSQQERLPQLLSGLARTLDRLQSSHPVTLLLVGSSPDPIQLSVLEQFARVLLLASATPTRDDIRSALAVLLPLTLPATTASSIDAIAELRAELGNSITSDHQLFLDAAVDGEEAVRAKLRNFVSEVVDNKSGREGS